MKYGNVLAVVMVFIMTTASSALFARSDIMLKNNLRVNAVGIATSSGSMPHVKERTRKSRIGTQSLSSVDQFASRFTNKDKVKSNLK